MDQGATNVASRADDRVAPLPRRIWAFAGYVFDLDGCSLARGDGGAVALTRGELALLREFVQRPGRVLSREVLLDAIAGRHADPFDRSIDVQVGRLRRKIEPDPKQPSLILTVPGEGYKFVASLRAVTAPPDIPQPLPDPPLDAAAWPPSVLRCMMGFTHNWMLMNLMSDDPAADIEAAWRLAGEARALSTGSPLFNWKISWLMAFTDQWHDQNFSGSVQEAREAVAMVPHDPMSRNDLSWILANAGYFDEAIEWARLGIRHDPNGPSWYFINLVWAYYLAGRYQEALDAPLRPEAAPDIYAAIYVRVGRMDEARRMAALAVKVAPRDSVEAEARFPLIEPYRAALVDDLRKAGMRERA